VKNVTFLFEISAYTKFKEKNMGGHIISSPSEKLGGTSFVSPLPNFAHEAACRTQHN